MAVSPANVSEQYKKFPDLHPEDVKNLQEWLQHQPHLPKITDLQVILFLYSCYCSNEATKRCIDNYYTVRTHCPEFFSSRDPKCQEIQNQIKITISTPLPVLTPEGYSVLYGRLLDRNPDVFNLNSTLKLFDMMCSLHLEETGALRGQIIVIDLCGLTLTHLMKFGLLSVKKYMFYLQEALPFRLKSLHFVNAVPFMDKLMALVKPFMQKELMDMLEIHSGDHETLFKSIPRACLPQEIGGTCGSIIEINEKFMKKVTENARFFLDEEKLVADEAKRPGKPRNAGDLFGVEGTFKKLDID